MRRNTIFMAFLLSLALLAPAYANESPDVDTALDLQAGRFQSGWEKDGLMVDFLAPILGYSLDTMYEPFLGSTPVVTVTAVRGAIEHGYGWHHWSSHGRDCVGVEFYDTATPRNQALTNYLNTGYTATELTSIDVNGMFGIGLRPAFFRRGVWSGSFVHLLACQGTLCSQGMPGVKTFLAYGIDVDIFASQSDDADLYNRLAGFTDPQRRTVGAAYIGTQLSMYGNAGLELAPMVSATNLVQNQRLTSSVSRYVHFSGPMNTNAPASSVVKGVGSTEVINAAWQGNDQIVFTVKPKYRGKGFVYVESDTTESLFGQAKSYPGLIPLVGNVHGPAPDLNDPPGTNGWAGFGDFRIEQHSDAGGDNPLAVVSAFRVENSGAGMHGRMMTEVEAGSDSFYVQRSSSPVGPFTTVANWLSIGPSEYVFDDPNGRIGDWYEAWEIDTAGVRTRVASEQATEPIHYTPDHQVTEAEGNDLITAMLQLYPDPLFNRPESSQPVLQWAAVVPNENYRSAIQPLVNMHNAAGLVADVLTMDEIVNTYGTIQDFSKFWRPYGLRFLLRCGDANNWQYHNNPLYYNSYTGWSNYPYGAQPLLDIMPLAYQLDPNGQMLGSTTYVTPEMPVMLDGDVDGDSLNDVAVGIMPAGSPPELALMAWKQLKYHGQSAPSNPHLTMYVDARMLNGNDGPTARQLADSVAVAARSHLNVVELINDDAVNLPYSMRQSMAVLDLASQPVMIMPFGVTTTRSNWAFLNKLSGFNWSQTTAVSIYPFLDGWSCDVADFDRSEDTYSLPYASRPIFHDAMIDTLHGPACGVGALRGTFIRGDFYSALAFHDIVLRHGAPSAGEAFVGAMHQAAAQYPEYTFQYRSFVYFGDPAAVIPGMVINATTAVGNDHNQPGLTLSRPWPNPMRGQTSIRYTLPTNTSITLSVVDVQGRAIRQLVSETQAAGVHTVNFTTDLNPGMYFLRLRAGAVQQTQKMVVIR